jgi:hypothetical protein
MPHIDIASLGTIWGMAVVVWGALAAVVGLLTVFRTPWTDEQIGRIHARIRRFRAAGPTGATRP